MRSTTRMLIVGLAGAAFAMGCRGVECAEGTFASGNDCLGYDPNDTTPPVITLSPAPGRSRAPLPLAAVLTADEAATVYFTIDDSEPTTELPGSASPAAITEIAQGSVIRFFAVDLAGNASEIESASYESDTVAPARPTDLTVTVNGADATVSWTPPSDPHFGGVMVARVVELIDLAPMPGQLYTAPAPLSSSLDIIHAGTEASVVDPALKTGPVRYVAWSYDDLGNYSEPVAVRSEIPGSLDARFEWDGTTLTQPVTPSALDFTGTTAAAAGGILTLNVTVKNNTRGHFLNPKLLLTAVANGGFTNSSGTVDTVPFRTLGPNAFAPDATTTATLTFNNLSGTTSIDLRLAAHSSLITTSGAGSSQAGRQQRFLDTKTLVNAPVFLPGTSGPSGQNGRTRPSLFVGQRFIDIPNTHGTIERFDLATGTQNGGATIAGEQRLNVLSIVADSAREFAVVKLNSRRELGKLLVVRFDENLQETGRLDLPLNEDRGFSRPAISRDGTILAVPGVGGIALVNTDTMTLIDADPNVPGVDLLSIGFNDRARALAFIDGANTLVAIARQVGKASVFRQEAGVFSLVKEHAEPTSTRGNGIALGPDGRVWLSFDAGLRVYDPGTNLVSNIAFSGGAPAAIRFVGAELWVQRQLDRRTVDVLDNTGATLPGRSFTLPVAAHGHWFEVTSH